MHLRKQVACRAIGIYERPLEWRAGRNSGAGLRNSNVCCRGGNEALRASGFGCVIVLEASVWVPGSKIVASRIGYRIDHRASDCFRRKGHEGCEDGK